MQRLAQLGDGGLPNSGFGNTGFGNTGLGNSGVSNSGVGTSSPSGLGSTASNSGLGSYSNSTLPSATSTQPYGNQGSYGPSASTPAYGQTPGYSGSSTSSGNFATPPRGSDPHQLPYNQYATVAPGAGVGNPNSYGQTPYSQAPYNPNAYGQNTYNQNTYGQPPIYGGAHTPMASDPLSLPSNSPTARIADNRRRIASLEASLDRVRRRADLATVSVAVRGDEAAEEDQGGAWTPGDAAGDAWGILQVVAGGLLVGLAVLAPFAVLALLARVGLRRRREAVLDG